MKKLIPCIVALVFLICFAGLNSASAQSKTEKKSEKKVQSEEYQKYKAAPSSGENQQESAGTSKKKSKAGKGLIKGLNNAVNTTGGRQNIAVEEEGVKANRRKEKGEEVEKE